jgi:RNA polymerase sigma-70 factor (ECF subfamily)
MIQSLDYLKEDDLEIIEMRFFEQRPFKEIADILNITESNAKVRTYRILERLKKIMMKQLEENP